MTRAQLAAFAALVGAGSIGIWSMNSRAVRVERVNDELAARVSTLEAAPKPSARIIERTRTLHVGGESPPAVEAVTVEAPEPPYIRSDAELTTAFAEEFAAEPIDAGWARQARGEFLPEIQKLMPASSRLESFECRSRFCEVVVVHDSVDISNDFLRRTFALEAPLGRSSGGFRASEPTKTADGKFEIRVYVARAGVSLAVGVADVQSHTARPDG